MPKLHLVDNNGWYHGDLALPEGASAPATVECRNGPDTITVNVVAVPLPQPIRFPRFDSQTGAWVNVDAEYGRDDNGRLMIPGGSGYVTTKRDALFAEGQVLLERRRIARKLYIQTRVRPALRTFLVNNSILTQAEVDFIVAQDWPQ